MTEPNAVWTGEQLREHLEKNISEAEFQQRVVELAQACGWRAHHTRPARTSRGWRTPVQGDPGFPDLVLARRGVVLFVELKKHGGKPSPEQLAWIEALVPGVDEHHRQSVYIWYPEQWPIILEVLK